MMGRPMARLTDQQERMMMQAGVVFCLCWLYMIGEVTAKYLDQKNSKFILSLEVFSSELSKLSKLTLLYRRGALSAPLRFWSLEPSRVLMLTQFIYDMQNWFHEKKSIFFQDFDSKNFHVYFTCQYHVANIQRHNIRTHISASSGQNQSGKKF